MTLTEFLARVQARKAALGTKDTPAEVEAMRNKGRQRTPEKRELLRRAEKRARAAGKEPLKPYHWPPSRAKPLRPYAVTNRSV